MSTRLRIVSLGGSVRPGSSSEQALRIAARRWAEDQGGTRRVLGRSGAL